MNGKKILTVAVHDGRYHGDDVFAVATLMMYFAIRFPGEYIIKVIRTRDTALLETADFRIDVGGRCDPSTNDYDHHQVGAPVRDNAIPYASFGLIWNEFGRSVCGEDRRLADFVEETLVWAVDAQDNGFPLYESEVVEGVRPFTISDVVFGLWNFKMTFEKVVEVMSLFLKSQIASGQKSIGCYDQIGEALVLQSQNPRLLVLDFDCGGDWAYAVVKQSPETLFVVRPYENGLWSVTAVPTVVRGSKFRAYLPQRFAGLKKGSLVEASGIPRLEFCHNQFILATGQTKESVIALAQMAINEAS